MKKRSGWKIMRRLMGLVWPLAGFMLLAVLMGLAGNLCAAMLTVFGGYALLDAMQVLTAVPLQMAFVCVVIFALARGVLRYGEQACNHFIAFKLLALIRDRVFQALRRLCPAKLEGRDRGDLISVITSDIELLEVFYAHTISPAAIAFLFTIVMCAFFYWYHPAFAALALAAYLTVGLAMPSLAAKLGGQTAMGFRAGSGELAGFVLDSLRGLDETIQYGQGAERLAGMKERTEALSAHERRMKDNLGRNMAATNAVILFFDFSMLTLAVWLYGKGVVSFEGVVIPVMALMSSFGPCMALANLGSTLQSTLAAGNRVLDILDEEPVTEDITGKSKVGFEEAEIKNVTFSYGGEKILENVSAEIPRGKIVGIVGKSGSGKSTLLKLLMRFWKVQDGEIRITGRNVDEINTKNLRELESFVTQETHLFHDSIRNNLRIAKLDATDAELEEACRKASVHDFIMTLPRGYDTPVGELGDTLSGGEWQRLGLARAFLHDAPLILLDEPTSNLDSLNEAVILKALGEERKKKTVVLVSHRPSTMRIADTIYKIEQGRMS